MKRHEHVTERRYTLRRLARYTGGSKFRLIVLILSGLLYGFCALGAPYVIGLTIDQMWSGGLNINLDRIGKLLVILVFLYIGASLFQWLLSTLSNGVSARTVAALRRDAFNRLTDLPIADIDRHPHGDFQSRLLSDCDYIIDGLSQVLIQFCSGLVMFVGAMVMMFILNAWVALAAILVTPLCFVVTALINKHSRAKYRDQSKIMGKLNDYAAEQISGHHLVRGFDHIERSDRAFNELNQELYVAGQKAQFYSSLTNPGTRFVNNIAYVLVGVIACVVGLRGAITVGAIAALLNYMQQFAKPVNEFSAVTSQFQNALAGAERLFELIDRPIEDKREEMPNLVIHSGEVEMNQVTFSYEPNQKLIEDLSLNVPAGQKIAIVGPTGAGKTTLVNLLMNFYELDGGDIAVDNQSIYDISRSSLRRSYGMVLQDSWLFSGTVHANIAYGRPNATREEVVKAAKLARAHEMIQRLPHDYDTVLTNSAEALSAGERQLLSIARVMLMNPKMLILDEATSNIDTRTEQLIQMNFSDLMKGNTSF
ncbi:MAG: ABC transporter ATP-binding protein, partial [Clostridiaceae bacterium]|nr:ABC transporter ATP-binding protein [Clostridiaceae bacterium]